MNARRLILFAAALLLLAALAASVAPREPVMSSGAPGSVAAAPVREPGVVEETIQAGEGADAKVTVRRGERLRLEVEGDLLDAVQIERLDRIQALEPGTPARFDLLADADPGVYPIRLIEADRRIGRIEITP